MRAVLFASLLAFALPARADGPAFDARLAVDGPVIAGSVALGAGMRLFPVQHGKRWESEPFAFDLAWRGRLSPGASRISDLGAAATIVAPIGMLLVPGADAAAADRFALYAETLAITYGLNTATKYLVQRPRPLAYATGAAAAAYLEQTGDDAYLSFYSGHAATTFAAAVAGSYLYAASTDRVAARAAAWGAELTFASMTATLRVRAGKHFPSDVLTGALIGAATGVLVPYTHRTADNHYAPTPAEWAAIAGGLALGVGLGNVMPVHQIGETKGTSLMLLPTVSPTGGGLVAMLAF